MDQECAAFASSGGIDARETQVYFDWLLAAPASLAQVFPEERGLVVLVPRFTAMDHKDPRLQNAMGAANSKDWVLPQHSRRAPWRLGMAHLADLTALQDDRTPTRPPPSRRVGNTDG